MALKDNLKKLREKAGYKQAKDFAKAAKIPYSSYSTYERGSWPNEQNLIKIADMLHVSIDELIGYTPGAPDELERAIKVCRQLDLTVIVPKNQTKRVSVKSAMRQYLSIPVKVFIESVHKALEDSDYQATKKAFLRITLDKYFLDAWRSTWKVTNGKSYPLTGEDLEKAKQQNKAYVQELKKHPNSEAYIEYFGAPGEVYEKLLAEHPDSEEYKEYYGDNGDDNEDNKNNNE